MIYPLNNLFYPFSICSLSFFDHWKERFFVILCLFHRIYRSIINKNRHKPSIFIFSTREIISRLCRQKDSNYLRVLLSFENICPSALYPYFAELRSRPIFGGSGSDPSKIKRLRLLVNCKAENYEFVTTKK